MKRYTLTGLALVMALIIGCSGDDNPLGTTIEQTTQSEHTTQGEHQYQYTGRNENNTVIVQGWIKINRQSDNSLTGTWQLESINNEVTHVPLGNGTLIGEIDKDAQANINLHPTHTDNNLRLIGTLKNGQFQGQWSYITFIGPTQQGAFEANQ